MDCDNSTLMQQEVEFQPGDRKYDIPPAIALLQAQNLNYGFISLFLGELFFIFPKSSMGGV